MKGLKGVGMLFLNRIMKRLVIVLIIVFLSAPALAAEWLGLDANMGVPTQIAKLENQGFSCTQSTGLLGVVNHVCRQGEQVVRPGQNRIHFSCEVVDGCDVPFDVLAQTFAEQGLIDSAVLERTQTGLVGALANTSRVCGNTPQGERLCVVENIRYTTGQARPEVELSSNP